jgi:hypothetical protein
MKLKTKHIATISVVISAATLLCGTAISYAQDRERPNSAVPHAEGMHRGEGSHKGDDDRNHPRRPPFVIVGVPIFVDPAYGSYYLAPPTDAYRTLDGFYYFCAELAGYYPSVQDCPSGWRLVP